MGVRIVNADIYLSSANLTGAESLAIDHPSFTKSTRTTIASIRLFILGNNDNIGTGTGNNDVRLRASDDPNNVTGSNEVVHKVDGADAVVIGKNKIVPKTDVDLGTDADKFKDLHLKGAINVGSDETGDILYRGDDGKTKRLPIGSESKKLASKDGQPSWVNDEPWSNWDDASRTSDSIITSTRILDKGTPIRYRSTGGDWHYGIIGSRAGDDHTILGAPCLASTADVFQIGTTNNIVVFTFNNIVSLSTSDITNMLEVGKIINSKILHKSLYLVNARCISSATASANPLFNARISKDGGSTFNEVHTGISCNSTSESTTGIDIDTTNYKFDFLDKFEIRYLANSGDGNISNYTLDFIFVIE